MTELAALLAPVTAIGGVMVGARLTGRREAANWHRDQQLKAYTELATVTELRVVRYRAFVDGVNSFVERPPENAQEAREHLAELVDELLELDKRLDELVPSVRLVASPFMASRLEQSHESRAKQAAPAIALRNALRPTEGAEAKLDLADVNRTYERLDRQQFGFMDELREDIHGEEDIFTWHQNLRYRMRDIFDTPYRFVRTRRIRRSMPLDHTFEITGFDDED